MKALVIKKNFQNHCAPATLKNGPGQGNSKRCRIEGALPLPQRTVHQSTHCARYSRQEFEEVGLTSRSQTLAMRAATLPGKFSADRDQVKVSNRL
jgi:hypothetical protein